jgi:hypothetical protein
MYINWERALARRSWYVERGVTNVVITAVWLKGLPVYDAYTLALSLGIPHSKCDPNELLVLGGIAGDHYRILASFDGAGKPRRALLSLNGFRADALLPPAFIGGLPKEVEDGMVLPNATDRLRDEVYSCTGERDGIKFVELAIALSGFRPFPGVSLKVITLPPGQSWQASGCYHCMRYGGAA